MMEKNFFSSNMLQTLFSQWMMHFPMPIILVDSHFLVLHVNEKAKAISSHKGGANYLENHFKASALPILINFKERLSSQFYVEQEIKLNDIGDCKLIGHRFEGNQSVYLIIIVPIFYKERFLAITNRYNTILHFVNVAIILTDCEYKIIDVNQAFTEMTGYTLAEVKGKLPSILKSGKQDAAFYKKMYEDILVRGCFRGELIDRKKSGELMHIHSTIIPLKNEFDDTTDYMGIIEDITEVKFLRSKLQTTTFKDPLTGLNNRESFLSVLDIKVELASENNQLALLFVDLNKFKQVNDTYGHQYGDLVLVKAANRMKKALRANDLIGRYGGDEFLILLERITPELAHHIASKINDYLALPYEIDEQVIDFISGSIGIAIAPIDAKGSAKLIERADTAMYEAKKIRGSNRIFLSKDLMKDAEVNKSLRNELINAIGTDEFFIRIQPIVDMKTGHIIGGEVLARWLNLYFNNVLPNQFFSIAQTLGIEKKIDAHILKLAIEFLENNSFEDSFFLTINITAEQFNDICFIENLQTIIKISPKLIHHLVLEITEHTMLINMELTSEHLFALRNMGIKIAIDDFGTGFSSLSYLKHFTLDYLKIDMSFINNITTNIKDKNIVQTIITLAKAIGAKTIVEGIETQEQYLLLTHMGADYAQGFYFDKPLFPEQFNQKRNISSVYKEKITF